MPDDNIVISSEDTISGEELEVTVITPEIKAKSIKDERDNIEIIFCSQRTFLVLLAVHKDPEHNLINRISCKKGIAIGGFVYDSTTDSYQIPCVEYIQLGYLPISLQMQISGLPYWQIRIPLAENVIKRFLTADQKKDIKTFKSIYKSEEHTYQFVQMIDCHV